MKARFVYEDVNFVRGMDPKTAMGIGYADVIHRWFKALDLDLNGYRIDKDLAVHYTGNMIFSKFGHNPDAPDFPLTFPMHELFINGSLRLDRSEFAELPEKLQVGGMLDLTYIEIKKLPDGLTVAGDLFIDNNEYLYKLPEDLKVGGGLYLINSKITRIPDSTWVGGHVILDDTKIEYFGSQIKPGQVKIDEL